MKLITQWGLASSVLIVSHVRPNLALAFNVGQLVKTSSGLIVGHSATNKTEVSEYLGIHFAKPPLGNLRFASPEPYTSTATFNATSFVSLPAPTYED
jgi:hypothetical protein